MMTMDERLEFCRVCENRKMNMQIGMVCGLTSEKPTFTEKCEDFKMDKAEAKNVLAMRQAAEEEGDNDFFSIEKKGMSKGVMGGILMMVIALGWFVGGWIAGHIFFYPPILFLIGLVALVRGAVTGNLSGRKV
jgi:hypothetical protein